MQQVTLGYLLGTALETTPVPIFDGFTTSFGRDEHSTVLLDDLAASRKHANVEGYEGGIFITDLGSTNGTFVDDRQIAPNEAVPLLSGTEIRIGGKVFYVISPTSLTETQKIVKSRLGAFSKKATIGVGTGIKAELARKKVEEQKQPSPTSRGLAPVAATVPKTKRFEGVVPGAAEAAAPVKAPSLSHSLSGKIGRGGLPQIIQMVHSKGLSGSMLVTGDTLAATILFLHGDLYSASTTFERGVPVIFRCAKEKQTEFSFNSLDAAKVEKLPRNITDDTMQILMECCNLMFEASKRGQ